MNLTTAAAIVYLVVVAGAVVFQLALALGAPWGEYAMGGRFPGRFPAPMRAGAVVQAGILVLLALVVLSAADLVLADLVATLPWLRWVPVVFSALSLAVNAASRSPGERRLWVPVAAVMLLASTTVAITAG